MKNIFKYIGESEDSGYQNGKIYMLEINGFRRAFIVAPIGREYKNWEEFFNVWERV